MFRFTIRDVLWLTVVVALGFGWAVHARRQHLEIERHESGSEEQSVRLMGVQRNLVNRLDGYDPRWHEKQSP